MKSVAYIPALALWGRLDVAAWDGDGAVPDEVRRIVREASDPEGPMSGPTFAGYLIHARLGLREAVVRTCAAAFGPDGNPRPFVPNHGDMSDSVFMVCPLLAAAGRLTGEARYLQACRNHFAFLRGLCLRPDGIYRHSPLDEAAWGRGNGFPALGLALVLREIPEDHPDHALYRDALRAHLEALAPHQDGEGMWHQVVDRPESYAEFSATAMISVALHQGLRQGWLPPERHAAAADRAWEAVKARVGLDGERVEGVCTSTGKQKSVEDYFRREAIFGRDERGGAMALLAAVERAAWERTRRVQ
jgi:rhamnogalacturonyl hydrolase YesR